MHRHISRVFGRGHHRVRRYARRHPRGIRALLAAIGINILFVVLLFINTRVYPGTQLMGRDVSGKTKQELSELFRQWMKAPYEVRVKDRTYAFTYDAMGMVLDEQTTIDALFEPNHRIFPLNVAALILSPFSLRRVEPTLMFTQQFYQFLADTVFDFSEIPNDVELNQTDKTLVFIDNEEQYRMEPAKMRQLLLDRIGNTTLPLYPKLVRVETPRREEIVDFAHRLAGVFGEPLSVYANAGGKIHQFYLPEDDLRAATTIALIPSADDIAITAHEDILNNALSAQLRQKGFIFKGAIANPKVVEDFQRVMRARFFGNQVDGLTIMMDQGPNTTGRAAAKYIEVDISQQMMYLFKDGKLVKSYKVSTGLEYPTPVGEFQILNKTGLGFSNIYQNWLPYWMGFKYSRELNAYFGIHEVPYTLSPEGKQLQPTNFIGSPNTGGCVALAPGAAREVYRFADMGTKVVIFQ